MGLLISFSGLYMITAVLGQIVPTRQECVCIINDDNSTATCDGLNLTAIPECLPPSLKQLFFRDNNVTVLRANTFVKFSELDSLNLDNNGIVYVDEGAFNGLQLLTNLSLGSNTLHHPSSMDIDAFVPLKKIVSLNLQGNCNYNVKHCQYPDVQVSKAPSIKHLSLDGLPNSTFMSGFGALKNLESLSLNRDKVHYCDLQFLPLNAFQAFGNTPLSTLEIYSCNMTSILPYTFKGLWNLTKLRLSYTNLCGDGIQNVTMGLSSTKITVLHLSLLCRFNKEPFIPRPEMFAGIQNTTLEYLDLSKNTIAYISSQAMNSLPTSLEYLSLAYNNIGDVEFLVNISRLENLQVIDGSFQNHYTTNSDFIVRSSARHGIRKAVIRYADMRDRIHPRSTKSVDEQVSQDVHFMGSYPFPNPFQPPVNLRQVFMNNIKFNYPVPPITLLSNNVTFLNASSCMLTAFLGPLRGFDRLEIFDLSSNLISLINPDTFKYMGNLRTLLLADNKLSENIDVDSKGDVFASQTLLEDLDLSQNNLHMVPTLLFRGLRNLKYLSLANNALSDVTFDFGALLRLEKMDLSGNTITHFCDSTLAKLDALSDKRMLEIDLRNNPLLCNCQTRTFANWLASTNVKLTEKERLECVYENGSQVYVRNIQGDLLGSLQVQCITWIILSACIGAFIFVFLVSTLVLILYRKRWQIRYLYHIGRRNVNPYHPIDDTYVDLDIDVYISYEDTCDVTESTSLREIVTLKLIPYLRAERLRVVCREELTSGKTLNDVISKAIQKSAKVLTLLSSDYCKFFWNTFEFNMAAYEGMYTKRKVLIPVIVGDVLATDLHKEIAAFIRGEHVPVLSLDSLDSLFQLICLEVQKDTQPQA